MILIPNFGGMLIKHRVKKYTSIIAMTIGMTSLWSCDYDKLDNMGADNTHVVVIGLDGLSPDGLQNADTPTFDKLMQEGASTMHARAVLPTSSSTNWASMIMGAGPEQHGITSNSWEKDNLVLPAVTQSEPFLFPSIFHLIRYLFFGKRLFCIKFIDLIFFCLIVLTKSYLLEKTN